MNYEFYKSTQKIEADLKTYFDELVLPNEICLKRLPIYKSYTQVQSIRLVILTDRGGVETRAFRVKCVMGDYNINEFDLTQRSIIARYLYLKERLDWAVGGLELDATHETFIKCEKEYRKEFNEFVKEIYNKFN